MVVNVLHSYELLHLTGSHFFVICCRTSCNPTCKDAWNYGHSVIKYALSAKLRPPGARGVWHLKPAGIYHDKKWLSDDVGRAGAIFTGKSRAKSSPTLPREVPWANLELIFC